MRNLTLLTDLYQLTMMQGYFKCGVHTKKATFDLFFRTNPFGSGYTIAAGIEQGLEYVHGIKFTKEDLEYLGSLGIFSELFLEYLRTFKFTGEIHGVKEGTVVFPNEPILRVTAPIAEAQFIETALLTIINHQSLIATKASRVAWAAKGDLIADFGLRRAQGADAGIYGARASYIGGCNSTSNVLAGKMFDIPVTGTHAHSWVMSFPTELEAFQQYARLYPSSCTLLVDTYDTIKSGIPNAIKVFDEFGFKDSGRRYGVRLDSGDLAYLSKVSRQMLDEAGHKAAFISASSDLDETFISELKVQGAKISVWGVGTKLITAYDCPALGGVYKLSAEEQGGELTPKIKISENPEKVTNPGIKKIFRIYDKKTKKMKADLISLETEKIDSTKDLVLTSPNAKWKQMKLKSGEYIVRELHELLYCDCEIKAKKLATAEIRERCQKELKSLWDEYRRLVNPHIYPVDLSDELYNLKCDLILELRGEEGN